MSRFDIDIVERLRYQKRYTHGIVTLTLEDAANEIERLRSLLGVKSGIMPRIRTIHTRQPGANGIDG